MHEGYAAQTAADEANLAAAVAAVAVDAEAALEVDAFDELPYLPADAVADVDLATTEAQAEGRQSATAREGLTSTVKSLLGPDLGLSDTSLLEIAVVTDNDSKPGVLSPSPSGLDGTAASAQGASTELVSMKQKSKTDKRLKLILLPNGLLMPMPLFQPTLPLLKDDKQAIVDVPKPAAAKQNRKAGETAVKFADTPLIAAMPVKPAAKSTGVTFQEGGAPGADVAAQRSVAGLRRASVTSQGSGSQVSSSPARSKSFSAVTTPGNASPDGRLSPSVAPASRQSPFQKAARTQISQHVERSNASSTVHGSPGQVMLPVFFATPTWLLHCLMGSFKGATKHLGIWSSEVAVHCKRHCHIFSSFETANVLIPLL